MSNNILTDIPDLDYTERSEYYNPEAFTELVNNRRSCRVYTGETISEEVMNACLDLAMLAPNSSNLQPWEFYWVRSKDKREKLNEYCLNQSTVVTASEVIVAIARRDTWQRSRKMMLNAFEEQTQARVPQAAIKYYDRLVPLAYSQGPFGLFGLIKRFILWIRGLSQPTPRQPKSIADMRVWANKSTALACENLMLAFRAHGYDTCPVEGLDHQRVRKLLGLPRKAEVCMAITVGKRTDRGIYGPRIRFDRELFVKEV